jgi:hypothetical protein
MRKMPNKKAEEILFTLKKINEDINFINTDVIQLIANKKLLSFAYKTIKTKKSFITNNVNKDWFLFNKDKLCCSLYQNKGRVFFQAATKKSFIKSKVQTPLTFNLLTKKIVVKTLQLVLEAIFKESLLKSGFGYNTRYTALQKIKMSFGDSRWVIKTRIKSCFNTLKHCLLFDTIYERIKCKKTIKLIRALFNERNQKKTTFYAGIPKKNSLGIFFSNLFLSRLDYFVRSLKNFYVTSKKHRNLKPVRYTLRAEIQTTTNTKRRTLTKQLYKNFCEDSDFRSFFYVRYGDSFVIAVRGGHRKEAIIILKKIDVFIQKKLFLELEQSKTLLIPFRKNDFTFVGIRISDNSSEYLNNSRRPVKTIPKSLQFYAPTEKILERFKKNSFINKDKNGNYQANSLKRLINLSHANILKYYNKVIATFLGYYYFADNYYSMQKSTAFFIRHSCALTLKLKYKLRSRSNIFARFGRQLTCPKTKQQLNTICFFANK